MPAADSRSFPIASMPRAGAPQHVVQFYESDHFLVDTVAGFVAAGLVAGETTLIIATAPHRRAIEHELRARGIDVGSARRARRYRVVDAAGTLGTFMVDDLPDARRFDEAVGGMLRDAASREARIRAFGEMVAVLWERGLRTAAIRLEELWNELALQLGFSLLCAYPLPLFRTEADTRLLQQVCGTHSQVVPAESYSALEDSEARLRTITHLQQRAAALGAAVADRQNAERALAERTRMLDALVNASPIPIVVTDPAGTVQLWNPAAEELFGWTAAEVIGGSLPMVPVEQQGECTGVHRAAAAGISVAGVETRHCKRDGAIVDVVVSAAALQGEDGSVQGIVLLFQDVTEHKRNEAERARLYEAERRARDAAETANRAKDQFLTMLGHELRTPLASVRNGLTAARLDLARREQALQVAHRAADQLARLIDDLLDIARITQGRILLRREMVSMAEVVERAVETARPLLEECGHTVLFEVTGSDVQVHADAMRLEQVIGNLLANAAKYTNPGGRITVTVEHTADDAVLRVRDTGIGIAAEMLPRVFDLFAQAEHTLERSQGGLGIGLTLVKQLVELHGGHVDAYSEGIGKGSEFMVRLPAATEARAVAADPVLQEHRPSARIVLVEDSPDTADSMRVLLELLGHRVAIAGDGPSAIEVAHTHPPDVMLVDIGLPGMDGYELARRIRQDPALSRVVLVALTGYGGDDDRQRALAAGFDYHLAKPVDVDAFRGLVARLVDPAGRVSVH